MALSAFGLFNVIIPLLATVWKITSFSSPDDIDLCNPRITLTAVGRFRYEVKPVLYSSNCMEWK